MANELGVRFTDEMYATQGEVSSELQIGYVESIWKGILSYRNTYVRYLSLHLISGGQFSICYCPSILAKLENVDSLATRTFNKINSLHARGDYDAFRNLALCDCLKEIVNVENLQISDEELLAIVKGHPKATTQAADKITNYLEALKYIESEQWENVDIDLLAEIYSRLTGTSELTSFYREEDEVNRTLINKLYNSAPSAMIEPMMEALFTFLKDTSISCFVRALVISFYVRYVKPFPALNSEISVLLMKALLVKEYGASAVIIPLEKFLSTNNDNIKKMFTEVQSTKDITYYVNVTIPILNSAFDSISSRQSNFEADAIQREYYGMGETQAEPEVAPRVVETPRPTPKVSEESVIVTEVSEEAIPAPIVEPEATPVVEKVVAPAPQPAPTPIVQPAPTPIVKPAPQPIPEPQPAPTSSGSVAYAPNQSVIATYLPPALDEREAQRLEEHLLELDPTMHRGEAAFYARHCTMGKKYTIQQCKRYLECAYETARKTMERLTELGYYKREMVKNKSVYTPIERKQ